MTKLPVFRSKKRIKNRKMTNSKSGIRRTLENNTFISIMSEKRAHKSIKSVNFMSKLQVADVDRLAMSSVKASEGRYMSQVLPALRSYSLVEKPEKTINIATVKSERCLQYQIIFFTQHDNEVCQPWIT